LRNVSRCLRRQNTGEHAGSSASVETVSTCTRLTRAQRLRRTRPSSGLRTNFRVRSVTSSSAIGSADCRVRFIGHCRRTAGHLRGCGEDGGKSYGELRGVVNFGSPKPQVEFCANPPVFGGWGGRPWRCTGHFGPRCGWCPPVVRGRVGHVAQYRPSQGDQTNGNVLLPPGRGR